MTGGAAGGYDGYLTAAALAWPDRVALRFEDEAWTYGKLQDACETAVTNLASAGVSRGTRVLLLLENSPEYLIAQFALARLRACFVTPNPYWTDAEIQHAAQASEATAAVHSPRFDTVVADLDLAVPAAALLSPTAASRPAQKPLDWQAALYVPFSSGTTGLPKGVMHTAASLCGGVEQLRGHLALSKNDRLQIALPMCHVFGTTMSAAALACGAEISLFRRLDLAEAVRQIRTHAITVWPLAGAAAYRLAERADLGPADFASLRYFMWGGSAVPADLARRITGKTGVRFLCSYGMTEAMMVAFNPVDKPDEWRLDSPGFATVGTELKTESGTSELLVRGPSVAMGYAGSDSDAFSDDGWFRTGDVARVDGEGRLWIADRAKDMIKVSGFQVAPVEVEQALMSHPGVTEAAVVGRPDSVSGEAVVAFVVPADPKPAADDLATWLAGRLATYKRPCEYRFVALLPRTVGGKVRRAELRAQAGAAGDNQSISS